ncbi:efflux RND transporter permease subunit [Bacillus spongiae]|uniref:Efflux RND transporter permease subunit n=1 Tax=Bacillus spongiae TaxID=2683610 RepID=A0ABU8HDQ0_9BACI
MKLLKFILNRKILVGLLVLFILAIGSYSVFQLDRELFPEMDFDSAFVEIDAGDMAAIEVERTITTPIEKQLLSINGVTDVHSTTIIGKSNMTIMFERGRGNELSAEVESVVNSAAANNPGIKNVIAGQISINQGYEFFMDISGGDMKEMTTFAKEVLEPRLEALPEVRDVMLSGSFEQELTIDFNRSKITELGIDFQQAINTISNTNTTTTLGTFSGEANNPSLRWNTSLNSIDDVKNISIPSPSGSIPLSDIANISLQPLESSSFVWKDGTKDLIFIQVGRVTDVTQIEMAEAVRNEIQAIRDENLVNGFDIMEIVAQADYIKDSLDGVTNNIIIGGLIAIVILFLFLRNLRATFIIGLSIPTSILLTFLTMWLFDYSFNILTLIALGLGIGMMVDSSIVILESIYRKKEQGLSNFVAVLDGTKEVATAVFASMLTTIVVFLPIGLLGGEIGQFMIILSAVVAITLISSVVVSFTLIPTLSEKFLKLRKHAEKRTNGPIIKAYRKLIQWIVSKKRYSVAVIGLFLILFIGSFLLISKIPMTIMPDMFNRYTELAVDVESGLSLEDKEEVITEITNTLVGIQDVETTYIMDNGTMFYLIINMTKGDEITREQKEVNEEILSSLRTLEENGPIESVASSLTGSSSSPIQVTISGEDFEDLQTIAATFQNELESIKGVVGVKTSVDRTTIEEEIKLKEKEMEEARVTPSQISQYIEQAFLQMEVGALSLDNETIPLKVRWEETTAQRSDLLNLTIPTEIGERKLSHFIELESMNTPNEISHTDGERFVSISADIEGTDLGTVNLDVQRLINNFETPLGYDISVAGDLEQQQQVMIEMLLILIISIFLVYLVMAVQFNHLIHPLVVMAVIPMTIVGVILGLFITKHELSVMSGMGVIMLIGIVLNNAILLIDRTNQLRKQDYSIQEALMQAGTDRIRPIFMTTLTTAGGMLPLALASGTAGNYQAPMATVIISGLLFATFITLLLIPAVYRLFANISFSFSINRKLKKKKKTTAHSATSAVR